MDVCYESEALCAWVEIGNVLLRVRPEPRTSAAHAIRCFAHRLARARLSSFLLRFTTGLLLQTPPLRIQPRRALFESLGISAARSCALRQQAGERRRSYARKAQSTAHALGALAEPPARCAARQRATSFRAVGRAPLKI